MPVPVVMAAFLPMIVLVITGVWVMTVVVRTVVGLAVVAVVAAIAVVMRPVAVPAVVAMGLRVRAVAAPVVVGLALVAPAVAGAVAAPASLDWLVAARLRGVGRGVPRLVVMGMVVLTGHLTDYPSRAPGRVCESGLMRVAALFTYPIKSCYRNERHEVSVEPWGFTGDRRWIVVDAGELKRITQRELPELGRITPWETATGLRLDNARLGELDVPAPIDGPLVAVEIGRTRVLGRLAGAEADAFVSKVVGQDARLVYLDDPTLRPVDPDYADEGDRVSFADGFPVLATNTASLAALNDWLVEDQEEPIVMNRFRPNLVVEGGPAWVEDGWLGRRLRVGDIVFRAVKPCDRCVLTTVDPETGERGRQPLRILGKHRRFPAGLLFGTNLIPDNTGVIRLADPVEMI